MGNNFVFKTWGWVFLIMLAPLAQGELEFYYDGNPIGGSTGVWAPTLSVYSSDYSSYGATLWCSENVLSDVQADTYDYVPNAVVTQISVNKYYLDSGSSVWGPGEHFSFSVAQTCSLLTLSDSASTFDVPVDTLYIYNAGPPGFDYSHVDADAGGVYQLSAGGSVTFDAMASTNSLLGDWNYDGIPNDEWQTSNVSGNSNLAYWSIGGVDIAFGLTPTISYDTLVNGLGLSQGIYELGLDLTTYAGNDTATTYIEIIPEPASLILLAFGALGMRCLRSCRKRFSA